MEYEEYMSSLTEQIHDRRARNLVEGEIRNHIEEQTEGYEALGMTHAKALQEAVRQMGNPVETGMELNKIHRPKVPWVMLLLALGLTVIAILMQNIIFHQAQTSRMDGWTLAKTLLYNGIGFCIILIGLHLDYNILARYAYLFYALYLMGISVVVILLDSRAYSTIFYGMLMPYPVIFSGVLYQSRGKGMRGLLHTFFLGVGGIIWYSIICLMFLPNVLSMASVAETTLIVILLVGAAVWKKIFGDDRKKYAITYSVCVGLCGLLAVVWMLVIKSETYLMRRVQNLFAPSAEYESSYMALALREAVGNAAMTGKQDFFLGSATTENLNDFLLNSIFTYYGKLAGAAVLVLLLAFVVLAFRTSIHQKNRIGFLIGMACSLSILVRVLVYFGINFGYSLWWTTLVPFLSYGKVSAVMNGIYVGLILCVYRNSKILKEDGRLRLELTVH